MMVKIMMVMMMVGNKLVVMVFIFLQNLIRSFPRSSWQLDTDPTLTIALDSLESLKEKNSIAPIFIFEPNFPFSNWYPGPGLLLFETLSIAELAQIQLLHSHEVFHLFQFLDDSLVKSVAITWKSEDVSTLSMHNASTKNWDWRVSWLFP